MKHVIFGIFAVMSLVLILAFAYVDIENITFQEKGNNETKIENESLYIEDSHEEKTDYYNSEIDWGMDSFVGVVDRNPYNGELQDYMESQVRLKENNVLLTADKINNDYISGKAVSNFAFKYGTFSFRVNRIAEDGLFPAVWMLPLHSDDKGEVDIFESVGSEEDYFYGVYHWYENNEKLRDYFKYNYLNSNQEQSDIIRFEWEKDRMEWFYDNKSIYRIERNVPDFPMYMILNLAVGGNWAKTPDDDVEFPVTFDVEIIDFKPENIINR